MTGAQTRERIQHLEAVRGLAALQVLLLHFFAGFMPGLVFAGPRNGTLAGYVHASPLAFLYDGYAAVYIFFGLSGYVLTEAFSRQPQSPLTTLASRVVRLGVPALAACVLSAAFFVAFGGLNREVGSTLGSNWYRDLWHPVLDLWSVLRDGLLNSLFLGYDGQRPMASIAPAGWLQPITQSYNSPLWTLSVEFYGSILIFALCWFKGRYRGLWLTAVVLGLVFFVRSHYLCFLLGHLLAIGKRAERAPVFPAALNAVLFVAGVALCITAEFAKPSALKFLCGAETILLFPCSSVFHLQKGFGAMLILVAIIQSVWARRWLAHPQLAFLGRLSFPIYLVHWPVLFGLSAYLFTVATPVIGLSGARLAAMAIGLVAALVLAVLFRPIDAWAVRLSRRLRRPSQEMELDSYSRFNSRSAATTS